jgi:hypothetical protein
MTETTPNHVATIVDQHVGYSREGYRYDLVALDGAGRKIRVRVLYSSLVENSDAVAEVLATNVTWTELAVESASNWHSSIPDREWDGDLSEGLRTATLPPEQHPNGPAIVAALHGVADRLLGRALDILR